MLAWDVKRRRQREELLLVYLSFHKALEGYSDVHEPDYRAGGSFGSRRVSNERFPRDSMYPQNAYQGEMFENELYSSAPASSLWPHSRRRHFDDEYSYNRVSRRPTGPFHGLDNFSDPKKYHEIDSFHDIDRFHDRYQHAESYHDVDGYDDYALERHARSGTRARVDDGDNYDLRHRGSRESRETSREREYSIGRYNYESDHDKGRKEGSWRRRDSREYDREKKGLIWERDQSPYGKHFDHSRSVGRDDRSRSRSPRGRTRSHSGYREDNYDDDCYDRHEKRQDYDRDESNMLMLQWPSGDLFAMFV
ncbi:hypothetical protein HPP92_022595 [Vanilla planifolia]|uniref:Uncharacterized protein n=1 Tax=Vanilla planifolia TaxID=51239 RepID=A0A835PR71_VANPL|nr:hypothetical protein HPP92_022595 [Vanilla planifolia]